ncbi:MAG: nickel-dependent hydrogenase large subunit, partial [Giesbergeria sp.]
WAHAVHNPLTQALVQVHRWAGAWQVPLQALHTPQPGAQVLTDLARALRADGDFARQPRLREQCRETGCWTRAGDAWLPVPDVWTRLAARVLDLAQLAQAQGAQRLHAGACALGDGEAIAWCEMARGLLVHWLRVDAQGRVERYGVLAPTEWNFHPQGAAAQVLRGLDAQQPAPQLAAAVAVLVAAFDPCVDYALAPVGHAEEVSCA